MSNSGYGVKKSQPNNSIQSLNGRTDKHYSIGQFNSHPFPPGAARSGGFEGNANHDSLGQDRRYSNREQDSKEDLAQHAGDIYWTSNEQENREQAKHKGDEDDEAEAAIIGFNNGSVQKIVK